MSHALRTVGLVAALCLALVAQSASAAKLTIDLGSAKGVKTVGAVDRWDADGNARKLVDQKAKIDAPRLDFTAKNTGGGKWEFSNLPKGNYDLVILAEGNVRVEGFRYPPVLDFDPFVPGDATVQEQETEEWITDDIKKSRHYENKVIPLYMGQSKEDKKIIRVLMMLIRDQTTSYEGEMKGASTIRHEVWQYDWQYGGWVKNRRTKVLDRILLTREDLRKTTWLWDAKLGGIEVGTQPITLQYDLTAALSAKKLKGLYPY